MKLPRSVSGEELVKSLKKIGYSIVRQKGSQIRPTCKLPSGDHHLTIPDHHPLKIGTLSSILNDISKVHMISKEELINTLFG